MLLVHTRLARGSHQTLGQLCSPLLAACIALIRTSKQHAYALAGNPWGFRDPSQLMSKVATGTDIEHLALPGDWPVVLVSFNSHVLHTDFRAKYAAAFLEYRAPSLLLQALPLADWHL
ncbi:MAG: hypothetical protein WAU15_03505 [Nitrosomonas sp.]